MYSAKTRKEILNYYHNGHTFRETCSNFRISQDTLARWLKEEKAGTPIVSKYRGKKPSIDVKEFQQYVDANPDKTQSEMAEAFGVSQPTICYYLKKIGYVLKKKNSAMPNRTPSKWLYIRQK